MESVEPEPEPDPTAELGKPVILAPEDGAGIGDDRVYTPKSSPATISSVEAGKQVSIPAGSFYGAAYGNGKYVGVSAYGQIIYSTNGVSGWTTALTGGGEFYDVCFGGGKFVAVAYDRKIKYSTDGVSWYNASGEVNNQFYGVTWGNGKFVAVGNNGALVYSTNGTSFQNASGKINSNRFTSVAYGDGVYVATQSSLIAYSVDANIWYTATGVSGSDLQHIAFGDGKFIAVGKGTKYFWSDDIPETAVSGMAFKTLNLGSGTEYYGIDYGNGVFVAAGRTGPTGTSSTATVIDSDTLSYTKESLPVAKVWQPVAYGDNGFVILNNFDDKTAVWSLAARS